MGKETSGRIRIKEERDHFGDDLLIAFLNER